MQITVDLTEDDVAMVAVIRELKQRNRRTPQKWEAVAAFMRAARALNGDKVFERLKLLGVIEHRRNGDCWLTDKAEALHG